MKIKINLLSQTDEGKEICETDQPYSKQMVVESRLWSDVDRRYNV